MSNIPGQCLPGELFGALVATLVFVTNFISIVLTCAILRKTLRRRETRNRCVETIVTSSNTAREICELRRVDNNEEIDGNSNRRSSGFGEAVRESHTDEISSYNSEIQRRLSNQTSLKEVVTNRSNSEAGISRPITRNLVEYNNRAFERSETNNSVLSLESVILEPPQQ